MSTDVDQEIERLYQLPLDQFTEARNALAVRLRARDPDAAARVKSLGKPAASSWAVNQVFWSARRDFDALIDASDRLRALQSAGATPNELREAMRERREALSATVRRAEAALARPGHAANAATLQRVATTLEALATYGSARPREIRPGFLTDDLIPPGFEAIAALPSTPALSSAAKPAGATRRDPEPASATDRDGEAVRVRAELTRLEGDVAARGRQAAAARSAAEEATRRAEGARSELAEAERRLAKAAERASEVAAAAEQAQSAAAQAAHELAEAERALEAARKSAASS